MDKSIIEKQIMQVYHATPEKIALVNKLSRLIKDCSSGIEFGANHLQVGELSVRMIEIDPHKIGGVLVHWFPDFNISTRNDPYCSAYMLECDEINDIINEVASVV